jgi:hypothetical protein
VILHSTSISCAAKELNNKKRKERKSEQRNDFMMKGGEEEVGGWWRHQAENCGVGPGEIADYATKPGFSTRQSSQNESHRVLSDA